MQKDFVRGLVALRDNLEAQADALVRVPRSQIHERYKLQAVTPVHILLADACALARLVLQQLQEGREEQQNVRLPFVLLAH
jgi:hypothetical protein